MLRSIQVLPWRDLSNGFAIKVYRWDHPLLGIAPAQQRFCADHRPATGFDQRLGMHDFFQPSWSVAIRSILPGNAGSETLEVVVGRRLGGGAGR
ncbi:MAG TPA: hypothetical protein PLD66_14215, partial [Accumulibacter sp.]|nr:hypothetical protein [Accumulibacter sp.]